MYIKVESDDNEDEDVTDLISTTDETDITTDGNTLAHLMFHTPSFGEDDFDFLGQQEKAISVKNTFCNFNQDLTPCTAVYTEPRFSFGQNFHNLRQQQVQALGFSSTHTGNLVFPTTATLSSFGGNSVVNSQQQTYTFRQDSPQHSTAPMMTTHRDSILESLESIAPKFPPQNLDIPDITVTNGLDTIPVSNTILSSGFKPFTPAHMYGQTNLSTPLVRSQLGSNTISPSSTLSTASPMRDSSEDSDDSVPLAQLVKRQAQDESHVKPTPAPKAAAARKPRTPKKKKKKDPNEPQKPVSAYALFFRDTQAAIKGQNPSATFGEVSKIVASMWEALDPERKGVYKKRTDMAKKEYLKLLAAYRASLVSQTPVEDMNISPSPPHRSPLGSSPQHMMGYNNNSPQHMTNTSHMGSPAHMASPQQMGSPAHMGSPLHAASPHHMSPPQHMPSPQHVTSPNHMTNHVTSPNHIPSPQHNNMFNFNSQQSGHYNDVGGYNNGQMSEMITDNNIGHLESQAHMSTGGHGGRIIPAGMCIRNGCNNRAIDNIGWDCEYCSNECVVSHCRDVFTAWVANRQVPSNCYAVK